MSTKCRISLILNIIVAGFLCFAGLSMAETPGQGALTIIEPDGKTGAGCPLEHTSVKAEVSGFVSRVSVTQTFHNPRKDKIEAVYTFPLPGDAAVNDMTMRVGDRVVKGQIKKRDEARRIYEKARDQGKVASLLDQERPNIFTQSVANIMPGQKVEITIRYIETLPYDDGAFTFSFPMVVGPRFIPGAPTGKQGTGWAPDTNQVPDASRITPPVTPKGVRAGHDIDLTVSVNAGVPILKIDSKLHEVDIDRQAKGKAIVSLKNKKEIPNRDFVLKYNVAGDEIRSGVLTHKDGPEGYVTVIMIPPKRVRPEQISPKEMIFVIDCSGSQSGMPLQKAKETMKYVVDHMNPDDTFNIIDFNSGARMLFSEPKKNTAEYRQKALNYLNSLRAGGGTWMGPAIETVCATPAPENRLRIVTFMTDGYVGNDFQIISMVQKLRGKSRWFPFGTGNSVNRFLLDNMARVGGGEVEYILLNSPGEKVAKKFYERIASPVLTDVSLTMNGIALEDVYPEAISDLWDRKPLVFKARYTKAGKGSITIKGFSGGKPYEQTLKIELPDEEKKNSSLGSLWARAKVDDLMGKDWMGVQRGSMKQDLKDEIIKVALAHRIMTQFTSFVAVEETVVTEGGKPTQVTVPVEMPDGVSREGVFGDATLSPTAQKSRAQKSIGYSGGVPASVLPAQPWNRLGTPLAYAGKPRGASPERHWRSSTPFPVSKGKVPRCVHVKSNFVKPKNGPVPLMPPPPLPSKVRRGVPLESAGGRQEQKVSQVLQEEPMSSGEVAADELEKRETGVAEKDKESEKVASLMGKLAPSLRYLVQKKGAITDYSNGIVTVKDGKLTVQVWLDKITDAALEKLKKAGLKVSFKAATGKMVIGVISVDKLETLAEMPEVKLIEPVKVG